MALLVLLLVLLLLLLLGLLLSSARPSYCSSLTTTIETTLGLAKLLLPCFAHLSDLFEVVRRLLWAVVLQLAVRIEVIESSIGLCTLLASHHEIARVVALDQGVSSTRTFLLVSGWVRTIHVDHRPPASRPTKSRATAMTTCG